MTAAKETKRANPGELEAPIAGPQLSLKGEWKPPRELALSLARASVSRRLGGLELPEAFVQASVASAACAYERETKAAVARRRRLNDKVNALIALNNNRTKGT